MILLMVQKSGPENQFGLVVYLIICKVLYLPGGDRRISEPSTVSILFSGLNAHILPSIQLIYGPKFMRPLNLTKQPVSYAKYPLTLSIVLVL